MSELSFDEYESTATPGMGWTYDDWWELALIHTKEDHPDWHPKMWDRFADDIARVWEGNNIDPASLVVAIENWHDGSNPYSPHSVSLDGYDYGEWLERLEATVAKKMATYALKSTDFGVTFDENSAQRFAIDAIRNSDIDVSYVSYRAIQEALVKWLSGMNPLSPHAIAFEEEVLELRKERQAELIERYNLSSSFSTLLMGDASRPLPSNYDLLQHIVFTQWYSDVPDAEKEITKLGGEEKFMDFMNRNIAQLREKYVVNPSLSRWA